MKKWLISSLLIVLFFGLGVATRQLQTLPKQIANETSQKTKIQQLFSVSSIEHNETYIDITSTPNRTGNKIYAEWDCMMATATIKDNGTARIELGGEPIAAGTTVTLYEVSATNKTSTPLSIKVNWAPFTVENIMSDTQAVTLSTSDSEEGNKVFAKWGSTTKSATISNTGKATIDFGSTIRVGTTIQFYIVGKNGTVSPSLTKTVDQGGIPIDVDYIGHHEQYVGVRSHSSQAGAIVYAVWNGTTKTTTMDSNGTATINLGATQRAGTKIQFYITNKNKTKSVTVTRTLYWSSRTNSVDSINSNATTATMKTTVSEAGATAYAVWNGVTKSATVNSKGIATITLGTKPQAGTNIQFYMINKNGIKSPVTTVTVSQAPSSAPVNTTPTLSSVDSIAHFQQYATVRTSSSNAGAIAYAVWNGITKTATVDSKGIATVNLNKAERAGTKIQFYIVNKNKLKSNTVVRTVYWSLQTTKVNTVKSTSQYATVTTATSEVGATAYASWNGITKKATVNSKGVATINLGATQKTGTIIQFYITNRNGAKSPTITVTVQK